MTSLDELKRQVRELDQMKFREEQKNQILTTMRDFIKGSKGVDEIVNEFEKISDRAVGRAEKEHCKDLKAVYDHVRYLEKKLEATNNIIKLENNE